MDSLNTELLVARYFYCNVCTIGLLYINGSFKCHTLEREWISPDLIPTGKYKVIPFYSAKRQAMVLKIYRPDKPNYNDEIHTGNFASDTTGCILVGNQPNYDDYAIYESGLAYNKYIMPIVNNLTIGQTCDIIIKDITYNKIMECL